LPAAPRSAPPQIHRSFSASCREGQAGSLRSPSNFLPSLIEVALLAYSIGLGEPGGDFVVDFVNALETEGVKVISRRESLDVAKARALQASRENYVAVYPILPDNERGETHSHLERDSRLFG
jgi:hypothetical protein